MIKANQGIRQKFKHHLMIMPLDPAKRVFLSHWMLGVRGWVLDVFNLCVNPRPPTRAALRLDFAQPARFVHN